MTAKNVVVCQRQISVKIDSKKCSDLTVIIKLFQYIARVGVRYISSGPERPFSLREINNINMAQQHTRAYACARMRARVPFSYAALDIVVKYAIIV